MASSPEPQKPEDNWDDWSDDALKTGSTPVAAQPAAAPAGAVAQNPSAKPGAEGEGDDWFNELFTEEAAGASKAAGTSQPGAPQGDWPSALFGESPQASESGGSLFSSVAGTTSAQEPASGPAPTVTKEKRNQRKQGKAAAATGPRQASSGGSKSPAGMKTLIGLVLAIVVFGVGGFEYKQFKSQAPPEEVAAPTTPMAPGNPSTAGPGMHTPPGAGTHMPPGAGTHTPPGALAPGSNTAGVHTPPGVAPAIGAHTPMGLPGPAALPPPGAPGAVPPPAAVAPPVGAASVSDTDFKASLKVIWNRGAGAKHAHKYYDAKVYWDQGLRQAQSRPGFEQSAQGFQDSLAHLHDPV